MIPQERFYMAMMHKEPDQVPVCISTATPFYPEYAGFTVRECYFDPAKNLQAQIAAIKRWSNDVYFFPGFIPGISWIGLWPVGSAFGAKVEIQENEPSYIRGVIKRSDEIVNFIKNAGVPNLQKEGYCPEVLRQLRWYMENVPKNVPEEIRRTQCTLENTCVLLGPADIAAFTLGAENFFIGMKRYPDAIHKFLQICEETCIEWIRLLEGIVGPVKRLMIMDHQTGMMSTKDFMHFLISHDRAVVKACPGALVIHHGETDIRGCLGTEAEIAKFVDAWHMCPQLDIGLAKHLYGDKIALIGNIDTNEVMTLGTVEDVDNACKEAIMKAAPGGGFVLSTGGGTFVRGRYENIDAMIAAAKKYGKYPIRNKE